MSVEDFSERIDLLVNDENRIVTYKILSRELKIHVNKAKQCLMDYFNVQKGKGINLAVHYFLAGFVEKDGVRSVKIVIVPEDKLENAKNTFVELTSFHIYSIYKEAITDECALYSADFTYIKDKDEQNKYSAIKHPNIDIQPPVLNKMPIKNDVRLNIPKKMDLQAPVKGSSTVNSKPETLPAVKENGITPEKNDKGMENQNCESKKVKTTPEDKKQKPGTLMSMWQKTEEKQNGVKKDSVKTETKQKEASKPVPKNNILSMFSKQAVKNAEKPVSKPESSKNEESPTAVITNNHQKNSPSKSVKVTENKKSSQKRKASNKISKQPSKSKQDSDSEEEFQPKSKKKHKRICTFDTDSESEPEEEKERAQRSLLSEEPMDTVVATPVSDDEEPIPPTPPVVKVKGKTKIWKTVKKTYEDEDGFFVTKNEKELVSASEDEEEPIKVKSPKKEEVLNKKNNTGVNKKQASLMSFFKQK